MSILPAVLVLGGLIFLHELVHFLLARACHVEVEEFSIGIGPKLAGVRRGETLYALRLLPILGYVRMAGMYPGDAEDLDPEDTSAGALEARRSADANARGVGFGARPLWQRVLIIAAGPFANFLVALVLYVVVFGGIGLPVGATMQIRTVVPRMPAASAGFRPGDVVQAVDGKAVKSWNDLHTAILDATGSHDQPIQITVRRDGVSKTLTVTPAATSSGPEIGIVAEVQTARVPMPRALLGGVEETGLSIYQSLAGIVGVIHAALAHQHSQATLMGPIGIGNQIDQASQAGFSTLLLVAALLSADLGLLNLLPVPALDGGRLVFLGLEWVRRGRTVDPAKEGMVHFVGLAVLMALVLIVSLHDIRTL